VHVTSDTQKIQSSDWPKCCCTLWFNVNSHVFLGIGRHFKRSIDMLIVIETLNFQCWKQHNGTNNQTHRQTFCTCTYFKSHTYVPCSSVCRYSPLGYFSDRLVWVDTRKHVRVGDGPGNHTATIHLDRPVTMATVKHPSLHPLPGWRNQIIL